MFSLLFWTPVDFVSCELRLVGDGVPEERVFVLKVSEKYTACIF